MRVNTSEGTNAEIIRNLRKTISILAKEDMIKRLSKITPDITLTPGRLVEAIMLYRGLRYTDLAEKVGEPPSNFIKVIDGRRVLTDELAVKIGKALNVPALVLVQSRIIDDTLKGKYEIKENNKEE